MEQSRKDRRIKVEPSWKVCDEGTRTNPTHIGHKDRVKSDSKDPLALRLQLYAKGVKTVQHGEYETSTNSASELTLHMLKGSSSSTCQTHDGSIGKLWRTSSGIYKELKMYNWLPDRLIRLKSEAIQTLTTTQSRQSEVDIRLYIYLWRQRHIMEVEIGRVHGLIDHRGQILSHVGIS